MELNFFLGEILANAFSLFFFLSHALSFSIIWDLNRPQIWFRRQWWCYTSQNLHLEQLVSKMGLRKNHDVMVVYTSHCEAGCSSKTCVQPSLLRVWSTCSCKIHSLRISSPAPCEGFSPSRVRTKVARFEVTRRKDVYARTKYTHKAPS